MSPVVLRDAKHQAPILGGPQYRCSWHGGPRNPALIDWIVIHDTESGPGTAPAVAKWGASSGAKGHASWHFTVDDNVLIRCLPDDIVSYTAYSPANDYGLHIEIVGRASWTRREWYMHQATLKRAAWQVARWANTYKIPIEELSDSALRNGRPGITTHAQCTRVFKKGSHTDPGKNFPMTYFLWLCRRRLKWLRQSAQV